MMDSEEEVVDEDGDVTMANNNNNNDDNNNSNNSKLTTGLVKSPPLSPSPPPPSPKKNNNKRNTSELEAQRRPMITGQRIGKGLASRWMDKRTKAQVTLLSPFHPSKHKGKHIIKKKGKRQTTIPEKEIELKMKRKKKKVKRITVTKEHSLNKHVSLTRHIS